jgi:LPXTG-motif cell wall-anchored protein
LSTSESNVIGKDKLPDTGEAEDRAGLTSGLLATIGGVLLYRSRRKKSNDNKSS